MRKVVLAWLAACLAAPLTWAQVSPGPLSRAHAAFEGPLKCLECHGKGEEGLEARCLACHKEIAHTRAERRGFHGRNATDHCASCHPEHAGVDFALIKWDGAGPDAFDHAKTGWVLEGKHAKTKCAGCHAKAEFRAEALASLSPRKDRTKGFTGLDTACHTCHKDPHRNQLGNDCARCHGAETFKPAAKFDHAKSTFALTGKHAKVACDKCHRAEALELPLDEKGRRVPQYKPLGHAECSACHKDPHKDQLGPTCSRCHTTDDFKTIDRQKFDHDKTRYPLRGKHATAACAKCHDQKAGGFGPKPIHATCGACHTKDQHAGKATLAGKPADCGVCHVVDGWEKPAYTVAQHKTARYPLEGKHAAVACAKCHLKNPPGADKAALGEAKTLLRPAFAACRDCHPDPHAGQLAQRKGGDDCAQCHTVAAYKPSTYNVEAHRTARMPLEGKHARASCGACHGAERKNLPPLPDAKTVGPAKAWFRLGPGACVDCHRDPHEGRFEAHGDRPKPKGCQTCHGQESFRPARFDLDAHTASNFPLEGAHRAVPCSACHGALAPHPEAGTLLLAADASVRMSFREKHGACADCHREQPHGTQFEDRGCEKCHDAAAFRPASRFDHKKLASFPLTGAHANVACARCHASRTDARGRVEVVYRPVPHRCQDCHAKGLPAAAPKR